MTIADAPPVAPPLYAEEIRELLDEQPDWWRDAGCRGLDPDLFFPTRGEMTAAAKAACAACPVRAQCLLTSLARGERFGIWGGRSERERRRLRAVVHTT